MMHRLIFVCLFMVLGVHLPTHAQSITYPEGLELSREEGRPLLLFFSGSDWSGLSMKMKNEIIDSPEFQKKINAHFVFLEIDFPKHEALSKEVAAQNADLKSKFQIEEYPVLLLVDGQEREITRLGYLSEDGKQLAEDLLRIVKQDTELTQGMEELPADSMQLQRLYQLAQELRRSGAIEAILQAGFKTEDPFFLLEKYRLLVEEGAMRSDEALSIREELLKRHDHQVHFTIALIEFQELAASEKDPRRAIRPLEDYLYHFGDRDCENVWRVEMMIAQFYLDSDEWPSALQHAETAYRNAPEERQEEIQHSLDYIRSQIGSGAGQIVSK